METKMILYCKIQIIKKSLLILLLFSITGFANTAEKLWSLKMAGKNIDASVAIGDVDRDGYPDIVVGSTMGKVIALDGYGREIWETDLEDQISITPTLMNVKGDNGLEVLVLTQSGKIHCLDGLTGELIWKNNRLGAIAWASTTIIASDLNQNGSIAVLQVKTTIMFYKTFNLINLIIGKK